MKKSLFLVSIVSIILLVGCKDSNNNPPTITNSMDYEFTVIIDGVSNKVKGTIDNPVNYNLLFGNSNIPISSYLTYNSQSLSIKDISHPNYVEGYPFSLIINYENNILGKVGALLSFDGSPSSFYRNKYNDTIKFNGYPMETVAGLTLVSDTLGFRKAMQDINSQSDATAYSNILYNLLYNSIYYDANNKFSYLVENDMQITDLGTPSTIQADGKYKLGETRKGYMPKTKLFYPIEYKTKNDGYLHYVVKKWSPPIELEFSFKSIRQ